MDYKALISTSIEDSIKVKKTLLENSANDILECGKAFAECLKKGGKILVCGNGGSAADAQHFVAELVVRYRSNVNRPALAAIALTVDPSIATAGGNDIGFDNVFARQVEAFGKQGDILLGITTSGNSPNVIKAFEKAKEMKIKSIALLGGSGGSAKDFCEYKVIVPSNTTARIQESHMAIYHIWCEIIESELFPELV